MLLFDPCAPAHDLRRGRLHKLHVDGAAADDRAVHRDDLARDLLGAVLAGLHGLGLAEIKAVVLDGLCFEGNLPR